MRFRPTCILLAAAMFLAPTAALKAQQPVISRSFVSNKSVAAVSLRPQQMLKNPANALLPIEVAKAAGEKYLGMDAAHIEQAVCVIEPPLGPQFFYALFLKADQPWDLEKLAPEITEHTEPGEILGRKCLVSIDPAGPCFIVLKETTLIAASHGMLLKLMDPNVEKEDTVLTKLLAGHTTNDDLYVAVDMEGLRPLISLGMFQAASQVPPELQKFFNIPMLLQSGELTATLDGSLPSRLAFHAASETEASQVSQLLAEGKEQIKAQMLAEMQDSLAQMRQSGDPVQSAMADYTERVSGVYLDLFQPKQQGNTFMMFDSQQAGGAQVGAVAVIGILVALLLPAVQAGREAARRNASMNNLKQLDLALLNYESVRKEYPAHAIYSQEGKPLLSWRVAILPYLEGGDGLYQQFHLDEPWDSDHNKQLIPLMPAVFSSPSSILDPSKGKTNYVAPVGEGFVFDGTQKATRTRDVSDGTSMTVILLETSDEAAVTWTKPADWSYDTENPLKGLIGLRPGVFLAAFCDGHVSAIDEMIDTEFFKAILTKSGGEQVNAP
ncbi:DUF1559 domain-containing protein [Aeoliella mucimassa]|uniref:DUF1559 domain-containing protein n=1 Tax=Aeoliella mucimassa TaxID=2527972 RepID=A0A518ANT0_9BACT|nr:DUF1559 domain-containing protein [Aeoliella mucimassa]QDU56383.1 hypothetical protein Pan181_25920 [Aeoliella mucimassa]